MVNTAFFIVKSRIRMHGVDFMTILAIIIFLITMAGAMPDEPVLVPNQTSSDTAANMTRMLIGDSSHSIIICPATCLAYVKITPTVCLFDITVPGRCYQAVSGVVAPLYATYLKQHPEYKGDLVLNVYAQDKTRVMTTNITNADAKANYEGIAYLMEKNADYLLDSKRTDGLETPMGY